jgi:hypothetical protein
MFVALASMQTVHAQNKTVKNTNPLLQYITIPSTAFNLIKDEDFKPAE